MGVEHSQFGYLTLKTNCLYHHFSQNSLGDCVEKHLYPNYLVVYIKWFKVVQFFRRNNIYASRIILLLITNALKPLINKGVLIPFVYFYPPNKVH